MILALAGLYGAILFGAIRWSRRWDGGAGTIFVFGASAFIYNLAIPVESVATGRDWIYALGRKLFMSDEQLETISVMAVLALIGFTIGFVASGLRIRLDQPEPGGRRDHSFVGVLALVAVSVAVGLIFFADTIVEVSSYEANYRILNTSPAFAFTTKVFIVAACVGAASMIRQGSAWMYWTPLVLVVASWGIYSSNKDPILIALLACGSLLHVRQVGASTGSLVLVATAALAGAAILPVIFSAYRAGVDLSVALTVLAQRGAFMSSDPSGPFVSLVGSISAASGPLWGESYLQAVTSWVPGFLWPGKPIDLAEEFARQNIAEWSPGRGLGFSLLGESYINFGLAGPLLQYGAIGWLWGVAWRVVRTTRLLSTTVFKSLYSVAGMYMLFIMHRGGTSLLVTQFAQIVLPVLASVFLVRSVRLRI